MSRARGRLLLGLVGILLIHLSGKSLAQDVDAAGSANSEDIQYVIPVPGDPICTKFVTPCPPSILTVESNFYPRHYFEMFALNGVKSVTGSYEPYVQIRHRQSFPMVSALTDKYYPMTPTLMHYSSALGSAGVPVAGDDGGCWIEVNCPKK